VGDRTVFNISEVKKNLLPPEDKANVAPSVVMWGEDNYTIEFGDKYKITCESLSPDSNLDKLVDIISLAPRLIPELIERLEQISTDTRALLLAIEILSSVKANFSNLELHNETEFDSSNFEREQSQSGVE